MRMTYEAIGLNKPMNPMIQDLIKKRWISSQAYYAERLCDYTSRVMDYLKDVVRRRKNANL